MLYNKKIFNSKKAENFIFLALFIACVVVASILFLSYQIDNNFSLLANYNLLKPKAFIAPQIKAKSAYVYDIDSNTVLFEKNSSEVTYLASITKIMTAVVAKEDLSPDEDIVITSDSIIAPDYLQDSQGEHWNRDELIRFMLFVSSNTAANAFDIAAKKQGKGLVFLMNRKAHELGLKTLSFMNSSGLDDAGETVSSYGNVKDVVKLFEYGVVRYPNLFEPGKYKNYNFISTQGNNYFAENTNDVVENIPGIFASKTGFTNLAGGNLIVGFEVNGHRIIACVLGSDKDARFTDIEALVTAAIKIYN